VTEETFRMLQKILFT